MNTTGNYTIEYIESTGSSEYILDDYCEAIGSYRLKNARS